MNAQMRPCKTTHFIVLATILFMSFTLVAQKKERTIESFVGVWEGEGKRFGNDAKFKMKWQLILDQKFLQLTFSNQINTENQVMPAFKAIGIYKMGDSGQYPGKWFDSRGVVQELEGTFEASTLTTLWSNPSIEKGKTVYRLLTKRSMEVRDYVWKGDQWAEFGVANYSRK